MAAYEKFQIDPGSEITAMINGVIPLEDVLFTGTRKALRGLEERIQLIKNTQCGAVNEPIEIDYDKVSVFRVTTVSGKTFYVKFDKDIVTIGFTCLF